MKKITFNYSIGDKVTLIKSPSWDNRSLLNYNIEFTPKEYRIRAIRYIIDEEGEKILYSLDAYLDEYLRYNNWLDESNFEGEGHKHNVGMAFISIDNKELNIGDKVYSDIYYGSVENPYISPDFTFTSYGEIVGLSYTEEGKFYANGDIDISKAFECTALPIKYWMEDKGSEKYTFYAKYAVKEIDDKFVEDYIKGCKEHVVNPFSDKLDDRDSKRISDWLNFMGIYDKVKNNYKKIIVRKRVKVKKDTTVDDILSSLTDKQKKELLKKLSK